MFATLFASEAFLKMWSSPRPPPAPFYLLASQRPRTLESVAFASAG